MKSHYSSNNYLFCRNTEVDLAGSKTESDSLDDSSSLDDLFEDTRKARALTIWTTSFTTITVTSTSYLSGTTVTLSLLCTLPGMTGSCFG